MFSRQFQIHGVGAEVRSDCEELVSHLEHDFHPFLSTLACPANFRILVRSCPTPQEKWRRMLKLGRSELYWARPGRRRVRFFGKAWVDYYYARGTCEIFCADPDAAYESCYFALMSYVGERLDKMGIHRVHGLAIANDRGGVLFLAPSGTGKSTLALEALRNQGVRILSDDIPLVNRAGELLGFPQRIALRERPQIEDAFVRKFKRQTYGEKFVVGGRYFSDRVALHAPLNRIVLMRRRAGTMDTSIQPQSRARLTLELLRWLVIGHETPQIAELFLRFSPDELVSRVAIFASRVRCLVALVRRHNSTVLDLVSDPKINAIQVLSLLPR